MDRFLLASKAQEPKHCMTSMVRMQAPPGVTGGYFVEVPHGGRIYIYGAGGAGAKLRELIRAIRSDITVLGFVDSFKTGEKDGLPVLLPDGLVPGSFDFIIVSSAHQNEISRVLGKIRAPYLVLDEEIRDHPNPLDLYRGGAPCKAFFSDFQPEDDIELLRLMLKDCHSNDEMFRPTNYWSTYEDAFFSELEDIGLKDFKSRAFSTLASFRGNDSFELMQRGTTPEKYSALSDYFYRQTKKAMKDVGLDIASTRLTMCGSPVGLIRYATGWHNISQMQFGKLIADTAGHINFSDEMIFCEIGSGLGRVPEILARQYPRATFLLFDIPPQVYVQHQYLTAVFGERVVPYRELISWPKDHSFQERVKGRIIVSTPHLLPEIACCCKGDVFWNSASFQEMEPHICLSYLRTINKMQFSSVYINALPEGNYWGQQTPGRGGTLQPVTEDYYFEGLCQNYEYIAQYCTDYFLESGDYASYIFGKK